MTNEKMTELIKKEAGIQKGSGDHVNVKAGDLSIEGAVNVAKKKIDSLLALDVKNATKEVLGTCVSMGVTVDGRDPREVQTDISAGKHDALFN